VGSSFDVRGEGNEELVYYNGFRAGVDVAADGTGARRLGIETMAATCVQGRGVMIDLDAHFGRDRRVVSYRDLRAVLDANKIIVEEGDFVCLHTGYAQTLLDMKGAPNVDIMHRTGASLDGRDKDIQQWITDSGAVALICDNNAVELVPSLPCNDGKYAVLPLHEHCLFRLGMHFGEYWHLTPLATWLREHLRFRFLLTAPPLRLPGAVGSPVTPVATV
jgi:kynurenine formamidase